MIKLIFENTEIHAPVIPWGGVVFRVVPKKEYQDANPRSLLHVSSELNRCNAPGIECLYASFEAKTSEVEYRFHVPTGDIHQFIARAHCRALLDLRNPDSWLPFGLDDKDFYAPFDRRFKRKEVLPLHRIGAAIAGGNLSESSRLSPLRPVTGIVFPSNAMHRNGETGTNIAFFKRAFQNPDYLMPVNQERDLQPTIADQWP